MQENKEKIDIKNTLSQFLEPGEPEMTQEEAIIKYKEKKNSGEGDEGNSEEQEHLERIKKELLASLERVKELEKKIFSEKEIIENKKLKVEKAKTTSSGRNVQKEKELKKEDQKERE